MWTFLPMPLVIDIIGGLSWPIALLSARKTLCRWGMGGFRAEVAQRLPFMTSN